MTCPVLHNGDKTVNNTDRFLTSGGRCRKEVQESKGGNRTVVLKLKKGTGPSSIGTGFNLSAKEAQQRGGYRSCRVVG